MLKDEKIIKKVEDNISFFPDCTAKRLKRIIKWMKTRTKGIADGNA